MAKAGVEIKPEDFYPEVKKRRGKSRDLPMNDVALRTAIENHLAIRLAEHPSVKRTDPLLLTQKGGPYSSLVDSCPAPSGSTHMMTLDHRAWVSWQLEMVW